MFFGYKHDFVFVVNSFKGFDMVSIVTIKTIGYNWDEQVDGFDLVLVLCNSLYNTCAELS